MRLPFNLVSLPRTAASCNGMALQKTHHELMPSPFKTCVIFSLCPHIRIRMSIHCSTRQWIVGGTGTWQNGQFDQSNNSFLGQHSHFLLWLTRDSGLSPEVTNVCGEVRRTQVSITSTHLDSVPSLHIGTGKRLTELPCHRSTFINHYAKRAVLCNRRHVSGRLGAWDGLSP